MPCDGGAAAAKADVEAAVPCRNMGLLLREHKPLLLGPSQVAGWGLFSHGSIERQELVTEYVGELVSHEEADRRGQAHGRRRRRALPTEPSPQPARTHLRTLKSKLQDMRNMSERPDLDPLVQDKIGLLQHQMQEQAGAESEVPR